jgi:hypothetical protein
VLASLAACGPRVEVQGERSRIATFGRYRTYAWVSPVAPARSVGEQAASLLDWRIHDDIDRALAAKGYVRTAEAPSLLVDYDVVTRPEDSAPFREYFRDRRVGGTRGMDDSFARGYEGGTLVLQLIDARTRELAFRGSATSVIEEPGDQRRLEEAVQRMLANLPEAAKT